MELTQEIEFRIGANTILVVACDAEGSWWHCLGWQVFETDYIGPFDSKAQAVYDAKTTYLDPLWAEMGWHIVPALLDAVPFA